MEKKTNLVKRLLKCGADPNEESKNNESILSSAIERNLFEIAEEPVKHGADVDFIDSKSGNPLGYAIQLCKSGCFFILQIINLVCFNFGVYTSISHISIKAFNFLIGSDNATFSFRLEILINVYICIMIGLIIT